MLHEHSTFASFTYLDDISVQHDVHGECKQSWAFMQGCNSSKQSGDPDLYTPVSEVRPLVGGLMQVDMAGSQTHHKLAAIAREDGCRFYSPVIGKFCLHKISLLAVSCLSACTYAAGCQRIHSLVVHSPTHCMSPCVDCNAHEELGCCMRTDVKTWSRYEC